MSDLLGISSSAVAAYQRALGTVSNNIANVSTEGYSRQTSTLQQSAPTKQANMYLGTGVLFSSVKRAFDTFAESNLRNSNTDLATQTPMVEYTQRVMDIMGDKSVGLSSALDSFFDAARSLSVDPASSVMRTSFLRSTEGVGSRFAELSGQLNLVAAETRQALESAAGQLNTFTEQLALVNQQLTKSTSVDTQAPELLDRRDLLLRQISEYSRIKTSFTANGIVSVSLGTTMKQSLVVDGLKSRPIGFDPNSISKLDMVIDPYGNTEPLSGASGGTIGGLNTFISQVLEPAQKNLDFLAQTFVDEVNEIQRSGIDAYGDLGTDMLRIDATAPTKSEGLLVLMQDPSRIATGGLFRVSEDQNNVSEVQARVSYLPGKFPVAMSNTELVSNPFTSHPLKIEVGGGRLYASITDIAAGMDTPTIYLDNVKPGQELQVLTKDGRQLIGTPLSVDEQYQMFTPENGFSPDLTYSTQYLNQRGEKGYLGSDVFYGSKASVVYEQKFDKLGQPDTPQPVRAVMESQRIVPVGSSTDLTVIHKGAILLNDMPLGELKIAAGQTLTPQDVVNWINQGIDANGFFSSDQTKLAAELDDTSTSVELVNAERFPSEGGVIQIGNEQIKFTGKTGNTLTGLVRGFNNTKADQYTADVIVLANDMNYAEVFNEIRMPSSALVFQNELTINGVVIGKLPVGSKFPSQYHDLQTFIQAIQSQSELTGVSARLADNGDLVLENLRGNEGKSITIGPRDDGGKPANALGMSLTTGNEVFNGMVRMTRRLGDPAKSDIRLSFGTFGTEEAPQHGTPFDLSLIGFRTGAYIEGKVPDDLKVFVTGQGKASIAASFSGQPIDPKDKLRAQSLQIKFIASDRYVILDGKTGTELSNRHYDPTVLEPVVEYQGLKVKFTRAPNMGDVFRVDGNHDGIGNNENMLVMAELGQKKIIGNKTLSETYIDQVNNIGNSAQQSKITQQALTVVNEQAQQARDKVSGVNLDDEAADLIRFQQAYQAAAKSLQVSGQLFDSIVQIR
jgi:flagellar hook-associated protein FlgK